MSERSERALRKTSILAMDLVKFAADIMAKNASRFARRRHARREWRWPGVHGRVGPLQSSVPTLAVSSVPATRKIEGEGDWEVVVSEL